MKKNVKKKRSLSQNPHFKEGFDLKWKFCFEWEKKIKSLKTIYLKYDEVTP